MERHRRLGRSGGSTGMRVRGAAAWALTLLGATGLVGCQPNVTIRTDTSAACQPSAARPCGVSALLEQNVDEIQHGQPVRTSYTLAFVEYDDQGRARDPNQAANL